MRDVARDIQETFFLSVMATITEKQDLLPLARSEHRIQRSWVSLGRLAALGIAVNILWQAHRFWSSPVPAVAPAGGPICQQASVLLPKQHSGLWRTVNDQIGTPGFKDLAVNWLSGAVRVPTESYDNQPPVGEDPRWEAFGPFHDYLLKAFPLVHKSLELTKVNTYGLFYEWKGVDDSLRPLLLAAHQDVVPVDPDTVNDWIHPPYSGHFDGERIWGRGSSDDKSGLIGILSAIETLLQAEFKPKRTVVLAFGFDEESSGQQGAGELSKHIEKVYGRDGIAMIVDEGVGFSEQYGSVVAIPGIAEKGFLNVHVEVSAPGGHSSIPPVHTSIGILSALLAHFESNPIPVHLTKGEPFHETLQCIAEHAKDVPEGLREVIRKSGYSEGALKELNKIIQQDPLSSSLVGTTQAIDLIRGGVKSNALPEQAWAVVNRRISVTSSVDEIEAHDTELLKGWAQKFNLTYKAFGTNISVADPSSGSLVLSEHAGFVLHPSPVTPTDANAEPYRVLSGTIKATFNEHRSLEGNDTIIVAPGLMTGNTDTANYWNLSRHIFRYNHHAESLSTKIPFNGIHTVNEFLPLDSLLEIIRFYANLILNADESNI